MLLCAAASRKGHRREEEEDLGHVRPPDCAGGETAAGSSGFPLVVFPDECFICVDAVERI